MKTIRTLLLLSTFVILSLAVSARGDTEAFRDLLSGSACPLRVVLRDLDANWRALTVHSAITVSDNVSVNVSGNTGGSTSQNNVVGALAARRVYLTKGQTVSAAGRIYLVAYHLPASGLDLGVLLQALATKTPPTQVSLTADSSLPLSLLDLQSIGSLDDIRVFDLQAEVAERQQSAQLLEDLFKSQSGSGSTNSPSAKSDPGK